MSSYKPDIVFVKIFFFTEYKVEARKMELRCMLFVTYLVGLDLLAYLQDEKGRKRLTKKLRVSRWPQNEV